MAQSLAMYEKEVEELMQLDAELFPDEVDALEDGLARKIGLVRGPGISDTEWRVLRVCEIERTERLLQTGRVTDTSLDQY